MSVSVERKGNEATLKFTIPVEEVAKGFERAVARVNKQVTIPGFRKGKAPRRVLEAHVGKDAIKEEAFQILANDNYRKALDDNNFIPVADPELKDSTLEEGKEMEMTLLVTLRPEVELGEYKNLDVKKVVREVTDKDVDDAISNLQKRAAKLVDAPEDRKLEKGDLATIDFAGTIDGEPFEGGEGKGYPLEIGSGSFIPGFEDQMVGLKKDESTDVNVTFPEDYGAKELAGKAAEFREKTLARLKKSEEDQSQANYERDVIKKAVENASFEVPEVMVTQRANQMVDELTMNLEAHHMSLPMYLQYLGKDVKTYRDEQKPVALENLKADLVLDAIAKKEDLKVTKEETLAEMQKIADTQGATLHQVQKIIKENGSLPLLVSNIMRRKAADLVLSSAKGAAEAKEEKTEE